MGKSTKLEKLMEKAEIYGKTSMQLCKYNTVYKLADIVSSIAIHAIILLVLLLFSLLLNIGLSLWIGAYLGKTYYGFLICAGLYLIFALMLYIFRYKWIKKPVSNFIINKLTKK